MINVIVNCPDDMKAVEELYAKTLAEILVNKLTPEQIDRYIELAEAKIKADPNFEF